jgi:hypothetical protein
MIFLIFILALIIRNLYFPNNIYFGFDQARDAFTALEIAHGHLKLIGPTTSFPGLNHGILYDYILAPIYLLGGKSPEVAAEVLRFLNALGIFLIFYMAKILFNKQVGFVAAFLYAISFEQTQFAIYMGNPSLASLTVILMYLGLGLVIFKQKWFGLPLAFLGLGFSIQFQFALIYLFLPFILILIFYYKDFLLLLKTDRWKTIGWSIGMFLFSLSTFIVAELKYNFRSVHALIALSNFNPNKTIYTIFNTYLFTISRMNTFNISGDLVIKDFVEVLLLVIFVVLLLKKKKLLKQWVFLGIWFFAILVTFIVHGGVADVTKDVPRYYANIGVTPSLLIFVAFLIYEVSKRLKLLALALILVIIYAQFSLITSLNPKGTITEIDVQQVMLLSDEKKVMDYMYTDSKGQPFAVKGVTMPYIINTTWSYLFEWYGKDKYGYLPIWNGKNALGYPGNLKVQEAQEGLPKNRYLIIEPIRGIYPYLISDYINEENIFTNEVGEKHFGEFVVQKRAKF